MQQALFDSEQYAPLFAGTPVKTEALPPLPYSVPLYGLKLVREETIRYGERPQIRNPVDCANILMAYFNGCHVEHMVVVMLDTKHRVIGITPVLQGSLNSAVVRVADIFKPAIVCNANSIVLLHNHPSGDPTPSPEDVHVTTLLAEAGRLLDIDVLDHLIIGHNSFASLKERGLAFS